MPRLLLLLSLLITTGRCARVNADLDEEDGQELQEFKPKEDAEAGGKCCCKESSCSDDAESKSGSPAVYSADFGLCCKFRKRCHWSVMGRMGSMMGTKGYPQEMEAKFCRKAQSTQYREVPLPEALLPKKREAVKAEPESTAETVEAFCDMQGHSAAEAVEEEEAAQGGSSDASAATMRRNEVIGELVKELSANSLDTMAKDIFSIYACVRWAMDPEFIKLAKDEIATEQLPSDAEPFDLYQNGGFIPLRCTRNIKVYGGGKEGLGSHYGYFEEALTSIADWLEAEDSGAVKKRLVGAVKSPVAELPTTAEAFDLGKVARLAKACPAAEDTRLSVDVRKAPFSELLANCAGVKWWKSKLKSWRSAFPFSSFMSPDKDAAAHAPTGEQQVLICFGKRVSSQLHRRAGGGHLITDQSAVGCHGFWSFRQSAAMIRRTVWLWRPPTCQLAAMELDMKLKLLDAIADINANLFDALPAMILDEKSSEPDALTDGPLRPAGAVKSWSKAASDLAGGIAGAAGWLFGTNRAYQRLGLLLGNTVVKWSVCPLKPLAGWEEESKLDGRLGTEDDVARYFAQQSYSKWTGATQTVPGEVCEKVDGSPAASAVPRCLECSLGIMQQDMPEPYHGESFICPVRPLMPAKPQLKVFEEKADACFLHTTAPQHAKEGWTYRGHSPHVKQYNLTEHHPRSEYESVKIVSWRRLPDAKFGIKRDWATYARRCTEDEFAATPRWCKAPKVSSPAGGSAIAAITGASQTMVAAGAAVGKVMGKGRQLAGGKETPPWNKAISKRMTNWVYGAYKRAEGGSKSLIQSLLGRSGKRQKRLKEKLFGEAEAGELLHSASFQKNLAKTGADSKDRQRLDRYAVSCACPNFKPEQEFRLKYYWGEQALRMLVGAEEVLKARSFKQKAFTLQLRGVGVLHMKDSENAWRSSAAFLRTTGKWVRTRDVFLERLVGVDRTALSTEEMFGVAATYACGSRKEMHDLDPSATAEAAAAAAGKTFMSCVRDGIEKNRALREAKPRALFFEEEVVVRVTFAPLEKCWHEHFARKEEKKEKEQWTEEDNSAWKAFSGMAHRKCEKPSEEAKAELSDDLRKQLSEKSYRGVHIAKDLPRETLLEVLLDPADVEEELTAALGALAE